MVTDFKKQVGERIRELRKNLGYSQQEVAQKLGLHRPSISQIEHGERELSAEELTKLSEFFGVTLREIVSEKADKKTAGKKKTISRKTHGEIEITFFRHGEATDDIYDQYGGWADPDLSPKGVTKAYSMAQKLKDQEASFGMIYTSPLKRARQVAEILGRELQVDVKVLQYLKERNTYGLLCGINKQVAQEKFSDLVEAYESGRYVLGSEREEDFINRLPLIFEYIKRSGKASVCCVTHGKLLAGIIKRFLQMNPSSLEDGCMLKLGWDKDKAYLIQSEGIVFAKQPSKEEK